MHEEPQILTTKPQQAVKSLLEYSKLINDTISKNFERFPLLLSECFIRVVYTTYMTALLEYLTFMAKIQLRLHARF